MDFFTRAYFGSKKTIQSISEWPLLSWCWSIHIVHAATGWLIFRLSPLALRHSLSTALPLLNTYLCMNNITITVKCQVFF